MVKWSDHALAQLRHIHDYIAQDSAFYAKRVTQGLAHKTLSLAELPRLGRRVVEIDEETVREVPMYAYRILYEIMPTHILILAVIHKRQHLKPEDVPRME